MDQTDAKLGRVVSVTGSQVITLLDKERPVTESGLPRSLEVGAVVKMRTPDSTVFGLVSGLSIPVPKQDASHEEMELVELELIGEATDTEKGERGSFRRGVSAFPALGADVYWSTQDDLAQVYARPEAATVRIGSIHQDNGLPAFILTDNLLGKHFAILGTTGSGKSCATSLILHAIIEGHPNGHVVLLDPHNEYARAFGDLAEVFDLQSLDLPYWLLTFDELRQIVIGSDSPESEVGAVILGEAVTAAKRRFSQKSGNSFRITLDTPTPYHLGDLIKEIDESRSESDNPVKAAPYLKLIARLKALQADRRYSFMFPGLKVQDNMAQILSSIFRVPVDGKPITIIDLSGVPSEILNVVVSVVCRMTFDFALWGNQSLPILLVCEEAHRYAPRNATLGFERSKAALSRIAKEGRKYGVSLCMVSQRPSELAIDVLSQCNTIFALRLSNQKDQDFVRGAVSESAMGLLDWLPSLRNAEAIVVGEGVNVPVRMVLDTLPDEKRPKSGTATFSTAWREDSGTTKEVEQIVQRWRAQRRESA